MLAQFCDLGVSDKRRLQVELPGLRGFGAPSLKVMRLFFENWAGVLPIRYLAINELAQLPEIRQMPSDENNDLVRSAELGETALIQIRQTTSAESVSPGNRPMRWANL